MKRLLYILSFVLIALSCTDELTEVKPILDSNKVTVDLSVSIPEAHPATKAFGDNPTVDNLYLAVFDESGFLVEYVKANPLESATTNDTEYKYSVKLTLSETARIIHFIANAPETIRFGREEEVITSLYTSGTNDAYWYRKEIAKIEAADPNAKDLTPAESTINALSNIPLVRNFAKIVVKTAADCDFTLTSYAVFNTPTQGSIAAYNRSKGEFVDYPGKSFETLIGKEEGYDAFVPGSAELNTEVSVNAFKTTPAYVYERETPINNPAYVLVYGTYGGKNVYYKVDLRDQSGKYFPILRNFQYTVTINSVTRDGYLTPEDAVKYGGSGDISTSVDENIVSLTNISDGEVRLSVEYTSKVLVTEDNVPLWYKFETLGSAVLKKVTIKLANDGNAISGIVANGGTITEYVDNNPISNEKRTITVDPAQIGAAQKTGSLLIIAEYELNGSHHTIQRKVSYTLTAPYEMEVKCVPGEVDKKINEAFDLNITIPDGLGSSMFPLAFNIEAQNLSITPDNDNLPVITGISNIPGVQKSAFWFVKYLTKEEYYALDVVDGKRTVQCHFKTNKAESATNIYVTNRYFVAYVNDIFPSTTGLVPYDVDYLGNYSKSFVNLDFSVDPIGMGIGKATTFTFDMTAVPDGNVTVTLINAQPADGETDLINGRVDANGNAVFDYNTTSRSGSFDLITTTDDDAVIVKLEASHFKPVEAEVGRDWMHFKNLTISPNRLLQGIGKSASISFTMADNDVDFASNTVTITLVGLKDANGKSTLTVKPSTKTVTIDGLVTTTVADEVKFTVSATGYKDESATKTRSRGSFSNLTFSQDGKTVTSLPSSTSQNVDFSFEMSDYEDGMPVTVELEGLESTDNTLTRSTTYTYTVNGTGKQTIKLKTVAGLAECWVKLSADGFDVSEQKKIQLVDKQTVTASLTFDKINKRTSSTNQTQVWTENDITFTNNKNKSKTNVSNEYNPIHLYSNQNVIVSVPSGGVITKIVFTCSSNNNAKTLQSTIGDSATRSGSIVTVTVGGTSSEYTISSLNDEVKLSSISVTYDKKV